MSCFQQLGYVCSFVLLSVTSSKAQENTPEIAFPETLALSKQFNSTDVTEAVDRAMVVLEKGVTNYPSNRSCFSCHHQALPLVSFSIGQLAKEHRLTESILKFTRDAFANRSETLREGGSIGGRALTVGYALWTLDLAGEKNCETTQAMVEYLLKTQGKDGGWEFHSLRPPAASSRAMTSAIAVYGLRAFGPEVVESVRLEDSLRLAANWLGEQSSSESTEDLIGQLWLGHMLENTRLGDKKFETRVESQLVVSKSEPVDGKTREPASHDALIIQLWKNQRSDGGWSQLDSMESDAYATGQALSILAQVTNWSPGSKEVIYQDPRFQRGIQFLLSHQQADGSWLVVSRSKPVQVFFDNGDPHEKNQFISMMATSWATTALRAFQYSAFRPIESQRVIARDGRKDGALPSQQ